MSGRFEVKIACHDLADFLSCLSLMMQLGNMIPVAIPLSIRYWLRSGRTICYPFQRSERHYAKNERVREET